MGEGDQLMALPLPVIIGGALLGGGLIGGGGVVAGVAVENATEQPTTQNTYGIDKVSGSTVALVAGIAILAWQFTKTRKR